MTKVHVFRHLLASRASHDALISSLWPLQCARTLNNTPEVGNRARVRFCTSARTSSPVNTCVDSTGSRSVQTLSDNSCAPKSRASLQARSAKTLTVMPVSPGCNCNQTTICVTEINTSDLHGGLGLRKAGLQCLPQLCQGFISERTCQRCEHSACVVQPDDDHFEQTCTFLGQVSVVTIRPQ